MGFIFLIPFAETQAGIGNAHSEFHICTRRGASCEDMAHGLSGAVERYDMIIKFPIAIYIPTRRVQMGMQEEARG